MEGDMDSPYESNSLDFEHVDPPVSSTTDDSPADLNDDLYGSSTPEANTADLLNFDSPPEKPSAPKIDPFVEPDTSSFDSFEPEPPAAPAAKPADPVPEKEDEKKKEASPCCASVSTCFLDLIYWRDVKKSGVVFGSTMITLLALAFFSVVSVLAYLALAVMMVTLSFSLYKKVMGAVQKSQDGHPFKQYLDVDVTLPEDRVHQAVDIILVHASVVAANARRLFLVEDLVDSIKFTLMLWVLTYIGSWFNGLTLIILATVTIFTAPKVYQTHKWNWSFNPWKLLFGRRRRKPKTEIHDISRLGSFKSKFRLSAAKVTTAARLKRQVHQPWLFLGCFSINFTERQLQTQIDNYLELAMGHVMKVIEQVKAKIPLPGKKKTQ